jgi:dTDP-glucose 4,6-dehydratase
MNSKKILVTGGSGFIGANFVEDSVGHDWCYAIDATKTNNELGNKSVESFYSGIKKTLGCYLASNNWWAKLI